MFQIVVVEWGFMDDLNDMSVFFLIYIPCMQMFGNV